MKFRDVFSAFFSAAVIALMDGLVVKCLWAMFIVRFFHQPAIPFSTAIGLCVLVGYMAFFLTPSQARELDPWSLIYVSFVRAVGALLTGGVAYLFTL